MTVRWLLALLIVLAGVWVLRRWLLWDSRRGGGVAPLAADGFRGDGGERAGGTGGESGVGAPEPVTEAERGAERSRLALRERGERVLDADRVSEQRARLVWLDGTLTAIERDAASGSLVELRRLRGELSALAQDAEPSEEAIASLERRVEALREAESPPAGVTGTTALFETPEEKDDLKKIKGIGPVMESVLNSHGVTTFRQLANFSAEDVERVSEAIGTFPGRIERDDWVGRARRRLEEEERDRAV